MLFLIVSSWLVSQTNWGKSYLNAYAKKTLQDAFNADIAVGSVEVIFPFSITIRDLTASNPQALLCIDSLSFTPLWLDLPFKRLTLLSLKAKGIRLEGEHPESLLKPSDATALSIFSLRLRSLHIAHPKIPGGSCDGTVRGKLSLSRTLDVIRIKASLTRSTPNLWPRKVAVNFRKNGSLYRCSGSLSLEGAAPYLFGTDDKLEWKMKANQEHGYFQNVQGTWKVSCPTTEIPIANGFVINRMFHARGSLSYTAAKTLSFSCDTAHCSMVFGKAIRVQSDVEGSGTTLLQYGAPLSFRTAFSINQMTDGQKGSSFELVAPSFLCNTYAGSLKGSLHISTDPSLFSCSAIINGSLLCPTGELPIAWLTDFSSSNNRMKISSDLAVPPFHLIGTYEKNEEKTSAHATFQCKDLGVLKDLLPFSIGGSSEILLHLTQHDAENEITVSSHFTNAFLGSLSCKQGELTLSSQNFLEEIKASLAMSTGKYADLVLDSANLTLLLNPKTQEFQLPEFHLVGMASVLPFNLKGTGEGILNKAHSRIALTKLDGTLHQEEIHIEQPVSLECYDFENLFSKALFSLRVGTSGALHGHWIHSSPSHSTVELSWKDFPFPIMASLVGIDASAGTMTGKCHYKTTPQALVGSLQMNADISRCGPLGNPDGTLNMRVNLALDNNTLKGNLAVDGNGITDPLAATFSLPIQRRPKSFSFSFVKDMPLEGNLKGKLLLSRLFYFWMPEEIGCEALLSLDTKFSGSLENIHVSGPVKLHDGRMELLATGQVLEHIEMEGIIDKRTLSIHSIKAIDAKEGSLSGNGSIDFFSQGAFTWQAFLTCKDLIVVDLPYASAAADGVITLNGTSGSLTIAGNASAKQAFVDVAARFPIDIPELPVTFIGETPNEKPPFIVSFDLYLDGSQGGKIQGRGLETEWKGHAHLSGPAHKLRLEGLVDCTKGTFSLAGKELSISHGVIYVNGNLFNDSRLSVLANVTLPSVSVLVGLKGSLKDPKFFIQSTPALPEKEILSLLLFNKEYGDISPLESLQLANAAMSVEQSSGPFELIDKVKTTLGIDLIDIGASPLFAKQPPPWTAFGADSEESPGPLPAPQNDVTLKVGKYISEGVAVTVSKDVSAGVNRIGLEAFISQHLTAQAEIGDDAGGIVSLKWKKDY